MAKSPGKGQQYLAIAGGLALFFVAWRFPVPMVVAKPATLLSAVAVLLGTLIGGKQGALIASLYVAAVILTLPQALWGGHAGEPFLTGPLNGLNLGLIAAAAVAGAIAPGAHAGAPKLFLAMLAGHLAYLACGFAWALRFEPWQGALAVAVYPFLIASGVKTIGSFLVALIASKFIK